MWIQVRKHYTFKTIHSILDSIIIYSLLYSIYIFIISNSISGFYNIFFPTQTEGNLKEKKRLCTNFHSLFSRGKSRFGQFGLTLYNIYVIYYNWKEEKSLYTKKWHCGTGDLVFLVIGPLVAQMHFRGNETLFGECGCLVYAFLFNIYLVGTPLFMLLNAAERYIAVVYPLRYKNDFFFCFTAKLSWCWLNFYFYWKRWDVFSLIIISTNQILARFFSWSNFPNSKKNSFLGRITENNTK